MDFVKEIFILIFRIITIYPLLLVAALFMGKRAIGELPVFDLLVILTLGSVVGADIADPEVSNIHTAFAVVFIAVLQKSIAKWKIKNRKVGKLLNFEPTIVIHDGKFVVEKLSNLQYSIDNILMMLRDKGVFDVRIVKMGIIEASGTLSILKYPQKASVTMEAMKLYPSTQDFAYPVVIEGKIYTKVLEEIKLNENWLIEEFKKMGVQDVKQVFFAAVNQNNQVHVTLRSGDQMNLPKLYH